MTDTVVIGTDGFAEQIVRRLTDWLGPEAAAVDLRRVVDAASERFVDARLQAFLPILVERRARVLLRAQPAGFDATASDMRRI